MSLNRETLKEYQALDDASSQTTLIPDKVIMARATPRHHTKFSFATSSASSFLRIEGIAKVITASVSGETIARGNGANWTAIHNAGGICRSNRPREHGTMNATARINEAKRGNVEHMRIRMVDSVTS